jgi:hypothetical protein
MLYCKNCGQPIKPIEGGVVFCTHCGTQQALLPPQVQPQQPVQYQMPVQPQYQLYQQPQYNTQPPRENGFGKGGVLIIALLFLVLIVAVIMVLVKLDHKHEWRLPTCNSPKVCTICGAEEGRALGHQWSAATCESPGVCVFCGATNGEPLAHQWQEATYEKPSTCSLCGTTQGLPLPRLPVLESATGIIAVSPGGWSS